MIARELSSDECLRYSRHIRLSEVGMDGQARLREARVLVVGMGGLGSPAALYLAAAGVGTLGLADFDAVELHNLQRQVLHGEGDVGRPKLESAARRIRELDSGVAIEEHGEGITVANAADCFGRYDIIVDGTDNFSTRYLNNDAAFFVRKPLVYGSIFQFEGQVSVFDPASGTPCYRCLFPQMPPPGSVPNCEEAGVFGALPGVIGSLQALETLKLLLGIGEPLCGRLLSHDGLRQRFHTLRIKPDPTCPLCGNKPSILDLREENYRFDCAVPAPESGDGATEAPMEIDIAEARQRMGGPDSARPVLIDVREPWEAQICSIPESILLPLQSLPERLDRLPGDRPLLVYCHHGMRSLKAAQFLRKKGFARAMSLSGGIEAWAREVDPSMPRY